MKPGGDAARWHDARDRFVRLGIHPKIAGALALAWLDADNPPESIDDAYRQITSTNAASRPAVRRQVIKPRLTESSR